MKSFSLLPNVLILVSYIRLKLCFAVERTKLIRRAHYQSAGLGQECHHACDCEGYPTARVCCERRDPDKHKKCHKCCYQHGMSCDHNKDCCSQTCRGNVCVPCIGCQLDPVGYCPILFPGDELDPPPKGAPFKDIPTYVQPSKTGPLKYVIFCPLPQVNLKNPEGTSQQIKPEDKLALSVSSAILPPVLTPSLMYLVKGMCEKDKTWRLIQGGLLFKHRNQMCFKIPIVHKPQLKTPHHTVDYTKYHVIFFWKLGDTIWPLWSPNLVLDKELRMLAKCNQALPYVDHNHITCKNGGLLFRKDGVTEEEPLPELWDCIHEGSIVHRQCHDCGPQHKDIYYKRLTPKGNLDFRNVFLITWSSINNVLGVDFNLFSTLVDAESDTNPWTFCNYNDPGIGFPRDCGPVGFVPFQWNSFTHGSTRKKYHYYLEAPL